MALNLRLPRPADGTHPASSTLARDLWRAACAVAICTAINSVMEPHFDAANLIMVYLGGVVYVAVRSRRVASLAAILGSILVFDWIYVEPRWSFNPIDPQYYFTFAVMLVVGLLISELAGRARQQAMVATARAARAQALNSLASALTSARTPEAVVGCVADAVDAALHAPCTLLMVDAGGGLPLAGAPAWVDPAKATAAMHGSQEVPYFALRAAGDVLGVLAVDVPAGSLHAEQKELLQAFANQAALAVERALLERRSAEAAVAAETERLRNTLLSGISHDFRTPMTTIIGSATTLLEQEQALDPERRRDLLRSVLGQAERMHVLTNGLLELTRMEEGAVQPRTEWCPADELVEEAIRAMGPRLERHRLECRLAADAVVWCDPGLVEQVLVNLLANAVTHTPPGGTLSIEIAVEPGWWRLSVADTGPGVPAGQETEVFKKFHREPGGTRDGVGLGLAICAAIARLHRGTISARNDGGACFTMSLPQPEPSPLALETA